MADRSTRNTPHQSAREDRDALGRSSARSRRQSNASMPWWSASSAAAPVNKFDVEIQQFFVSSRPSSAAKLKNAVKNLEVTPNDKDDDEDADQFHSAPSSPNEEGGMQPAQPTASLGLKRATQTVTQPEKAVVEEKVMEIVNDRKVVNMAPLLPSVNERDAPVSASTKVTKATTKKAIASARGHLPSGGEEEEKEDALQPLASNSRPRRSAVEMTLKRLKGGAGPVDLFALNPKSHHPNSQPTPTDPVPKSKPKPKPKPNHRISQLAPTDPEPKPKPKPTNHPTSKPAPTDPEPKPRSSEARRSVKALPPPQKPFQPSPLSRRLDTKAGKEMEAAALALRQLSASMVQPRLIKSNTKALNVARMEERKAVATGWSEEDEEEEEEEGRIGTKNVGSAATRALALKRRAASVMRRGGAKKRSRSARDEGEEEEEEDEEEEEEEEKLKKRVTVKDVKSKEAEGGGAKQRGRPKKTGASVPKQPQEVGEEVLKGGVKRGRGRPLKSKPSLPERTKSEPEGHIKSDKEEQEGKIKEAVVGEVLEEEELEDYGAHIDRIANAFGLDDDDEERRGGGAKAEAPGSTLNPEKVIAGGLPLPLPPTLPPLSFLGKRLRIKIKGLPPASKGAQDVLAALEARKSKGDAEGEKERKRRRKGGPAQSASDVYRLQSDTEERNVSYGNNLNHDDDDDVQRKEDEEEEEEEGLDEGFEVKGTMGLPSSRPHAPDKPTATAAAAARTGGADSSDKAGPSPVSGGVGLSRLNPRGSNPSSSTHHPSNNTSQPRAQPNNNKQQQQQQQPSNAAALLMQQRAKRALATGGGEGLMPSQGRPLVNQGKGQGLMPPPPPPPPPPPAPPAPLALSPPAALKPSTKPAMATASTSFKPSVSGIRPTTSATALLLERALRETTKGGSRAESSIRPHSSTVDGSRPKGGGGGGEGLDDGWTLEQVHALKTAYHLADPSKPHFWMEVAKSVPGKTANECFAKVNDRQVSSHEMRSKSIKGLTRRAVPSKRGKRAQRGRQEADDHDDIDDDPLAEVEEVEDAGPPNSSYGLHTDRLMTSSQGRSLGTQHRGMGPSSSSAAVANAAAPSGSRMDPLSLKSFLKAPTLHQSRKWAREEQLQALVARRQAPNSSRPPQHNMLREQRVDEAEDNQNDSIHPELAEAMKAREDADRYIASFLNKAGGHNKWQKMCMQGQEKRVGGAIRDAAATSRGGGGGGGRSLVGHHRGAEGAEVTHAIASVLQSSYLAEQSAECDADEALEGQRGRRRRGGGGGFFGGEGQGEELEDEEDDGLMWEIEEEEEEQERRRATLAAASQGLNRRMR